MTRTVRVTLVGVVAALGAVIGCASAAQAHVSVSPDTAPRGGNAQVSLVVPNESDTTATVKLEVRLPTDHPIPGVAVRPVPGWTARVITGKLPQPVSTDDGTITTAVTEVVWTANSVAAGIQPGQFQDFTLALDGLPEVDSLAFKAVQTYADGTVVSWLEEPQAGQPEPAHPAPVLRLTRDASPAGTAAAAATTGAPADSSGAVLALAVFAVLFAAAALVLGVVALVRTRRAG